LIPRKKKAIQKPLKKEVHRKHRSLRIRRQYIETIDPQEGEGGTETTQEKK
jgi:hypothetical protein